MPVLIVHNVHKTYRMGKVAVPVLHGVDLEVERGESVSILGASGSGKSTLLHLIGGLDRPDKVNGKGEGIRDQGSGTRKEGEKRPKRKRGLSAGTGAGTGAGKSAGTGAAKSAGSVAAHIEFDGRVVTSFSGRELDRYRVKTVGLIFQFYHLLPELTVLQNVMIAGMIGKADAGLKERALELIDAVGLGHRTKHRPAELSGGERQRVAIARALVNKPDLILADEPTGNLDEKTGKEVLDLLDRLRRESRQTMVVVTHDPQTAGRTDRVVHLRDGKIVESGS